MPEVAYVAPFLAETTLRFVAALSRLEATGLSLVSQDPVDRVPSSLRPRIAEYVQVRDALDPGVLMRALEELRNRGRRIESVLGTFEELQVPLGRVRDQLGLPGMGAEAVEAGIQG